MYGSPIGQNEEEERHMTARTEDNLSAMRDFVPHQYTWKTRMNR